MTTRASGRLRWVWRWVAIAGVLLTAVAVPAIALAPEDASAAIRRAAILATIVAIPLAMCVTVRSHPMDRRQKAALHIAQIVCSLIAIGAGFRLHAAGFVAAAFAMGVGPVVSFRIARHAPLSVAGWLGSVVFAGVLVLVISEVAGIRLLVPLRSLDDLLQIGGIICFGVAGLELILLGTMPHLIPRRGG